MHAQKGASEAPRTRFRACKTSKFSGGVPPDPPCTIYVWAPLFVFALGPSHPLGGPANTNTHMLFQKFSTCACWVGLWEAYTAIHTLLSVKPIPCAWVADSPPLLSLSWMPSMTMSTFSAFVSCWTLPPVSSMLSLMSTSFSLLSLSSCRVPSSSPPASLPLGKSISA